LRALQPLPHYLSEQAPHVSVSVLKELREGSMLGQKHRQQPCGGTRIGTAKRRGSGALPPLALVTVSSAHC